MLAEGDGEGVGGRGSQELIRGRVWRVWRETERRNPKGWLKQNPAFCGVGFRSILRGRILMRGRLKGRIKGRIKSWVFASHV
jgi:hypothetical protein